MKQILFTILMAFQSIGHASQIQCKTEGNNSLPMHLDIKVEPSGVNYHYLVKGTTVFSGPRLYSVYHTDYSVTFAYMRIGYRQSFSTQFPNGPLLSISGRSFTNEGPIDKLSGTLSYYPGSAYSKIVSLNCKILNNRVLD